MRTNHKDPSQVQTTIYWEIIKFLQWGFYVNLTVYLAYKFDWPINDLLYNLIKYYYGI